MKIDLNKVYVLSDQFGMRFIKPVKFDFGWDQVEFMVFYKHEYLHTTLLSYDGNQSIHRGQQKLSYLQNLIDNPRIVQDIYWGLIEVPQELVDYVSGKVGSITNETMQFPFTSYSKAGQGTSINFGDDGYDINNHRKKCYINVPGIDQIRNWKIEQLV